MSSFVPHLSTDLIIIIVALFVFWLYGLYFTKRKLVSLLVAQFISALALSVFPYFSQISFLKDTTAHVAILKLVIYIVLVVITQLVIEGSITSGFALSKIRSGIDTFLLGATNLGVFIVVAYQVLSFAGLYTPTIISVSHLTSLTSIFWTIVVSLIILFFANK